ncbi:MAG: glycoside hydrolase family 31 protein [Candidatus Xenobia bacterium]
MPRLLPFLLLLLLVAPAAAQDIGPATGADRNGSALQVHTTTGDVTIKFLTADMVRVTANAKPPDNWAVSKTDWPAVPWKLVAGADGWQMQSARLTVDVKRSPLEITFRDRLGHVINRDQRPMQSDGHHIEVFKTLGPEEHFYGLGEKAALLDRRRGKFQMWTSDTPGYKLNTDPLYQSVPFYIGWEDGKAYGIFFDNTYRTAFDFGASQQEYTSFSAPDGPLDYYFFAGPSMQHVVESYTELTGRVPMLPLWTLGHQQCRWSYYPASLVKWIVQKYRTEHLPLDAVHLDIHYMDGYRVFTWDPQRFPDPGGLVHDLLKLGVHVVTIVDPGVKYQPEGGYSVYQQGLQKNYFVRQRGGSLYVGKVWPGPAVFVDYTLAAARHWWGDLHRACTQYGVAGIWNDMNEPADFVDPTGAAQKNVVYDDKGLKSGHDRIRNVFALLEARATYEGLRHLLPDGRPYIISRSGFAGIQRYATMWTGDNNATWDDLALSIPMLASLGLSGESFAGCDIGGFNGHTNAELLTRWYEVAFLSPFCRNHMTIDAYDHEPWRFGTPYENIIRRYLLLRYRLIPFLYTQLEHAHRTGVPIFRPLLLNFQHDYNCLSLDDEFMIGDALLSAPILHPGQRERDVYLPPGRWYDWWTRKPLEGGRLVTVSAPLDRTPLFVRGGTILPLGAEMEWTSQKPNAPLTLEVFPDAHGQAAGSLYEDDGATQAFERGVYKRSEFRLSGRRVMTRVEGSYRGRPVQPGR